MAICRRFVSELRTGREGGLEWVDEWRVRNLVSVSRQMWSTQQQQMLFWIPPRQYDEARWRARKQGSTHKRVTCKSMLNSCVRVWDILAAVGMINRCKAVFLRKDPEVAKCPRLKEAASLTSLRRADVLREITCYGAQLPQDCHVLHTTSYANGVSN